MKSRRPKIALVDDDPLVLTPLVEALTQEGCEILSAADGVEALAIFEREAVDLAIIDVALPGHLDGIALAREVKQHKPDLRIIFMSGKPPPDADLEQLGIFLLKPTRLSALLDAIGRVLGRAD